MSAACSDVEDLAQAKTISVTTKIAPIQVDADYKLLASALLNLLRNAIKQAGSDKSGFGLGLLIVKQAAEAQRAAHASAWHSSVPGPRH